MNAQPLNTTGKRIKRLRLDYSWNQVDLALRLQELGFEVGDSHISRIEKSTRNPSPELLSGLAKALGTTTDYLLLLTDNPLPSDDHLSISEEDVPYGVEDPLVRSLLDAVGRLSRSDQAMLLGIAERLATASQPRIIGGEETSE